MLGRSTPEAGLRHRFIQDHRRIQAHVRRNGADHLGTVAQPLFEYEERFGGFTTRVLELEGSGPPLVLLHGWADSADTWRPLLDRLGRIGRRAIAVDLPG